MPPLAPRPAPAPAPATAPATAAPEPGAERPPQDLRLVAPALTAWATAAGLLGAGPAWLPWTVAAALAVLAAIALLCRHRLRRYRPLAGLLLSAGAAAAATALVTADLHRGPLPALAQRQATVSVDLTVSRDPKAGSGGAGSPYTVLQATVDRVGGTAVRTPVVVVAQGRAAARWQSLLPSTRLRAEGRLQPAEPGEAVAALLFTRGPPQQLAPPSTIQRAAGALRDGLRRAVRPLDPDPRALLPGLVVGDTSAIPPDLEEAFLATDLAHITAVSGANLSIVLVLLIGAAARSRTPERGGLAARIGLPLRLTASAGALLTLCFVILCRPDPSVLRAAATGLIMLLALATGRRASALAALAGATLLLMLVDPWLARSYGFALSALATAGILVLGPRWAEALVARGWPARPAEALACAAAAQALCGPLLALKAARVSLVAIPCNLLAEVAVAPATLLGFAALAAAPLSMGTAELLARLASFPTEWLITLARWAADLPGAELGWPGGWFGALLLVAVTCAALACLPVLRRPLVAVLLLPALLLLLLRPAPLTRLVTGWPPSGWRVVACDVGQGDALVLSPGDDPGSALVIDAGPDPHAVDRCLRELDVTRVPLVLLTHDHADHVEGLPGVLHDREVGAIETTTADEPPAEWARISRWAAAAHVPLLHAAPGEQRTLGRLHWRVLWPDGPLDPSTPGPNNASVALLVTTPGLRMAFLGDLEPPAQARLLGHLPEYPALRGLDLLKVAHHGSANQDADLIRVLAPRLALISCGANNRYGHPAPSTLALLRSIGSTVLRTDLQGDLAVLDQGGHISVATRPR